MIVERSTEYLLSILHELRSFPTETEWVEFKHNNSKPDEIGEYISALSNSAALYGKTNGYLIWGVNDQTHDIIGTTFTPGTTAIGNEVLENWLLRLLTPKIDFCFHQLFVDNVAVILLEIKAAFHHPVQFKQVEYIRIGSYKKKLKDFPEKERALWRIFDKTPFEREIAAENISAEEVLQLLNYPAYFDRLSLPLPDGHANILDALKMDDLITVSKGGKWNITNLGAVLFAKKLTDFSHLKRKVIRVIVYKDNSRINTLREQESTGGYAIGFENLMSLITNLLPQHEVIGQALRKEIPMLPIPALRELVPNAMIHQDFHITGTSPMIEIFSDRMEITNPGLPLVKTDRFLDSPPRSRNEALASFMRRIHICEERGTGIDKTVYQTELYQLPAPLFETTDEHTRVILFAHKNLNEMDKNDRIRACYLHACLKWVSKDYLTNTSLRERFGIEKQNKAAASRYIREAVESGAIKPLDEAASKKMMKYVPYWA
jgi:ATP-dependent DNA helicase RecG